MLLDRDVGEVHVGVGDVLLLGAVAGIGETGETTPEGERRGRQAVGEGWSRC